jgi:hypothetical protein
MHVLLAAAQVPSSDQVDVVRDIANLIVSPVGGVAVVIVLLWAVVYRRMIPRGTHETEVTSLKESYERAIRERDAQIIKLEARADRWEQYALFGRQRLQETLDAAGAPKAPTGVAPPQ